MFFNFYITHKNQLITHYSGEKYCLIFLYLIIDDFVLFIIQMLHSEIYFINNYTS